MKQLQCRCGQRVHFNNDSCVNCGRKLVFDSNTLSMKSEETTGSGLASCTNSDTAVHCNWAPLPGNTSGYCLSCAMSKTIPTLSNPENHARWRKLEAAKRRLIYDLLRLGLPVDQDRLQFHFKEDNRTNPNVSEQYVTTGHASGVITINAAEADAVFREEMRQMMNEPWRTLLGHMRHESGHYYFGEVVDDENRDEARALFGDESASYEQALQRYYQDGPSANWNQSFISAYATSHPSEDWAECWAHYLHIQSVLQVAFDAEFLADTGHWHERFVELVVSLNEIMRAFGLPDAYPFVLTTPVVKKIEFIHNAVARYSQARREQLA